MIRLVSSLWLVDEQSSRTDQSDRPFGLQANACRYAVVAFDIYVDKAFIVIDYFNMVLWDAEEEYRVKLYGKNKVLDRSCYLTGFSVLKIVRFREISFRMRHQRAHKKKLTGK
ncbi:hypothetical protein A7975_30535 [Bacillus sp. FJAT-26390]|nr:hypothetical protein A7975_30535 [Bacillus sp. FJAT-26390]